MTPRGDWHWLRLPETNEKRPLQNNISRPTIRQARSHAATGEG